MPFSRVVLAYGEPVKVPRAMDAKALAELQTEMGGRLLALKGSRAAEEIEEHGAILTKAGLREPEVVLCGVGIVDPATTVVRAVRRAPVSKKRARARR